MFYIALYLILLCPIKVIKYVCSDVLIHCGRDFVNTRHSLQQNHVP